MQTFGYRVYPSTSLYARAFYGKDGAPLSAGDRLVQRDLARSLRMLADQGAAAIYGGALGEAIDRAMRDADGFLALDDLELDQVHVDRVRVLCEVVDLPHLGGAHLWILADGIHPQLRVPRWRAIHVDRAEECGTRNVRGFVRFFVQRHLPGGAAAGGWTSYPPLSGTAAYSGGQWGQTLWILAVALEFAAFLMGGINFITTVINLRAPGMGLFDLPLMV